MKNPDILTHLIELAGNTANAYTTALFQLDIDGKTLIPTRHLTLSKSFNEKVRIGMGQGPIGKSARHAERRDTRSI